MRGLSVILLIAVGSAFADQPTTRPLTPEETVALDEPIAVGGRILAALSRCSKASEQMKVPPEFDVLTRVPTIEILRAAGYISDSDASLARRYKAAPQLIPANSPPTQPLLTMQTDQGELIFDTRAHVTLRQHP